MFSFSTTFHLTGHSAGKETQGIFPLHWRLLWILKKSPRSDRLQFGSCCWCSATPLFTFSLQNRKMKWMSVYFRKI